MTVLSVLSVLRCCDFSNAALPVRWPVRCRCVAGALPVRCRCVAGALPVHCRCKRKEIKMYVIAVAWFFKLTLVKMKLRLVMSQDRLEALFAISFHRKRYFITVKRY